MAVGCAKYGSNQLLGVGEVIQSMVKLDSCTNPIDFATRRGTHGKALRRLGGR